MHAYNNISVAFLSILLLYERNRVPLEEQIYEKSKRKRTRYALSLNVQSKPGGGVKENYFLSIFHSQTILWSAWNTRRFILKQRSDVYIGLYINMYWVDVFLFPNTWSWNQFIYCWEKVLGFYCAGTQQLGKQILNHSLFHPLFREMHVQSCMTEVLWRGNLYPEPRKAAMP